MVHTFCSDLVPHVCTEAGGAALTLHLWRADSLCSMLEVDTKTVVVTKAIDQLVNPSGALDSVVVRQGTGQGPDNFLRHCSACFAP